MSKLAQKISQANSSYDQYSEKKIPFFFPLDIATTYLSAKKMRKMEEIKSQYYNFLKIINP